MNLGRLTILTMLRLQHHRAILPHLYIALNECPSPITALLSSKVTGKHEAQPCFRPGLSPVAHVMLSQLHFSYYRPMLWRPELTSLKSLSALYRQRQFVPRELCSHSVFAFFVCWLVGLFEELRFRTNK